MLQPLHVGLDWSGRAALSARQPDVFIACFVAVEDEEPLKKRFDVLRAETFGESSAELHGYRMRPERIAAALQIAIELEVVVAALCIHKTFLAQRGLLPAPAFLHEWAALEIWGDLLRLGPVARLAHDTEVEGKDKQKRFATDLKREHSALHPKHHPKIKPLPSHKSDLIQMADVVAYALSRELRGEKVEPEIRSLLREIRGNPGNTIR